MILWLSLLRSYETHYELGYGCHSYFEIVRVFWKFQIVFILLSVPDLFRVMDSDESGQFRELGSDEDYDGYSS